MIFSCSYIDKAFSTRDFWWRFGILERFLFQATLKNMTLSRTSGIFAHTPSASFVGLRLGPLNGDFGDPKGYELSPTAGAQFYRSQERWATCLCRQGVPWGSEKPGAGVRFFWVGDTGKPSETPSFFLFERQTAFSVWKWEKMEVEETSEFCTSSWRKRTSNWISRRVHERTRPINVCWKYPCIKGR